MAENANSISVIIPTLAEAKRHASLLRAIDSILSQEGVHAIPIVVVNGNRFDPSLVEQLEKLEGIKLHMEATSGLVNAHVVGRSLVETPYFSFLDDDDEYLSHALRIRLDVMRLSDQVDLVVSNGYRFDGEMRSISAHKLEDAKRDPFLALLDNNWLTSCGGLYRAKKIDVHFFEDAPEYAEWTYLAFKIAISHEVAFVDNPSYVINDTDGSVSKSTNYNSALADVMARILALPLPSHIRPKVRRKYGSALHDLSSNCLQTSERKKALKCHLKSLCQPGGLRFFLYTRKFLGL